MSDIPVIDITLLSSDRLADRRAVAARIGEACRGAGFFLITGHGVPPGIVEAGFAASRRYFDQPLEAKLALQMTAATGNRGYAGLEVERLNERAADLKEAFNIGLDLGPDDPQIVAKKPFRAVNLWPDLPGWRATVLAYYDSCMHVSRNLHRGFSLDLGIAEDFFDDKIDQPIATLRMLHYPPAPAAGTDQPGAGEHTDYGTVTILATDGVPGLEVRRRDGGWIRAPHVPGAFICNIGDCLMRWTNDIYVSTPHRVVPPARDRYSIAFFVDPNPEAVVRVLDSCRQPGEPLKYEPVTGADYLRSRFAATYSKAVAAS
ncbi:MAG TPA: 2-oxoglutarate and iron-dependent oxygenase domain-containing protein [Alphaproteobacteria bacterium]|nr:2-oxoglutarate and iron-dependent oxygenase domain-containing protein [Alphaproteobacteria bacterium]